jgi:hypothetical protein
VTSLARPIAYPLYEGGGTSALVPDKWDVAIAGHPFMIDWKQTYLRENRFSRQSVQLLKPQQDQAQQFSEASLNPEEFVRRSGESWHLGAGQTNQDRSDGTPYRFVRSKGIDCWTKWQISLLNDVTSTYSDTVNPKISLVSVGDELWAVAQGTPLRSTDGGATWTGTTGFTTVTHTGLTTDGYDVWVANGASGVYKGTRGSSVGTNVVTDQVDCIGYAKGRLMASSANSVYNVVPGTPPGHFPTALFTQNNSDFRFVGFAEGHNVIYSAGYSGDKSLIYRVGIKTDGTALDPASFVVAGELPDGELVSAIQGYLGYLCIGTSKGVRFAQPDTNGDLTLGAVIPTPYPVTCFEPQDRFVWFGWTNYDGTSTGLGRLDLSNFTGPLTPAYATDLMVTGQGNVTSIATNRFGRRVFGVGLIGIYMEATTPVATGTIDSGYIYYGIPDDKVAMYLDVRHAPLNGTVYAFLGNDYNPSPPLIGSNSTAGSTSMTVSAGLARGQVFTVRLQLTPSGGLGPVVTRWTLEANPAPGRGENIDLPLLFYETVQTLSGPEYIDTRTEYEALLSIEALGEPIIVQDISGSYVAFLDDHTFLPESRNASMSFYDGTVIVHLRRPRQRS